MADQGGLPGEQERWSELDRRGRRVVMSEPRWEKITGKHQQLEGFDDVVRATIRDPDQSTAPSLALGRGVNMTRNPGWERVTHTKKGAHPLHKDHYVWVVAEMSDEEGFAVTALTNRKPPTGHLIYQRQTWEH